jgi:hypothetical protein
MTVAENMENSHRYKLGRQAGQYDNAAEIESDMPWFVETGFNLKDPEYVAGYEFGFKEKVSKKKKK